jgi:ribosomal-protein-alanine N-acetyltransferase
MTETFDFSAFPALETERLILRETSDADAPALFELYRDPEMTRFVTFSTHASVEDTKGFIGWMANAFRQKDSIRWGIVLKETNDLIGTGGLHFWKRELRMAEVGYHIGRAFWGRGYATEALYALVDFGFQRMNLNRIEGRHNAGNHASGRVMEKVGFQREGIWRQREIKDGKLVDVVQFALLYEDYFQE